MSEEADQPTTVLTPPPTPHRTNKVTQAAAWVGIVAGVTFIVAVVFFSGFFLGKHSDGGPRGRHQEMGMFHHEGPPMGFGPPRIFLPGGPGPGGPQQGEQPAPPRP